MIKHFNSSKVANEMAEPLIPSQFEITIIPNPALIAMPLDILKEDVKSVGGFDQFERIPAPVRQQFGPGIGRLFPGVQVDNVIELNLTFNVNLRGDSGTEATTLLALKRMKDLQFNRATGQRGLKKDCVWQLIVTQFTKDDAIWRVATMNNCMFGEAGITGLDEVNIESDEPVVLSFSVMSDKNMLQYASTF